jgi:probable addiction module antidote protein
MDKRLKKWDIAEHLDSEEAIQAYLEAAMEDGDPNLIKSALNDIARARGMTQLAKETGLTRPGIYQALSNDGNPSLSTLQKILGAFNLRLSAKPISA